MAVYTAAAAPAAAAAALVRERTHEVRRIAGIFHVMSNRAHRAGDPSKAADGVVRVERLGDRVGVQHVNR